MKNYCWNTFSPDATYLNNMSRDQIRDALQFCIRNDCCAPGGYYVKDGLDIKEWITLFTVKLLDPTVK